MLPQIWGHFMLWTRDCPRWKTQMDDTDGSVAPRAEPAAATTPANLPCYLQELDVAQLVELSCLKMLF